MDEITADTTVSDIDTVMSGLEFESSETRTAKKALELAKAKVAELSVAFTASEKQDSARRNEATRLAKRLLKEGLSVDTVALALQKEYGRIRKAAPAGEARKSHKLSDEGKVSILNFVNSHPAGISAKDIWDEFAALDKQGVSGVVKRLVDDGNIRAVGNTRQRKYFPIQ